MSDTRVKNKEMRESEGNTHKVRARVRCGCRAAPDGRFCHRWLCALWPESLTQESGLSSLRLGNSALGHVALAWGRSEELSQRRTLNLGLRQYISISLTGARCALQVFILVLNPPLAVQPAVSSIAWSSGFYD